MHLEISNPRSFKDLAISIAYADSTAFELPSKNRHLLQSVVFKSNTTILPVSIIIFSRGGDLIYILRFNLCTWSTITSIHVHVRPATSIPRLCLGASNVNLHLLNLCHHRSSSFPDLTKFRCFFFKSRYQDNINHFYLKVLSKLFICF